ncbi:hypothetical protein DdX_11879 [Ditylenchus destructor]|uniref:Uncharacterized protein n=1 Tax=Ditylenchus destructor TaxID=166010 RepID=A0AAD4QXW1_9BILA|nr:hypothetical protein DdX_11879 [Ditylenchus destructor]
MQIKGIKLRRRSDLQYQFLISKERLPRNVSLGTLLVCFLILINERKVFISADELEEDVEKFVDKLSTLTSSTADVMSALGLVNKGALALLKLGFPIGSIVAGSLTIASKTESPEYRALLKLHNKMDKEFKRMDSMIKFSTQVISLRHALQDYSNHVHVQFHTLRRQSQYMNDPAKNKSQEAVSQFIRVCHDSDTDPLRILDYIYENINQRCKEPHADHVSLYLETGTLVREIRQQAAVKATPIEEEAYWRQRAEMIGQLKAFSLEKARNMIRSVRLQLAVLSKGKQFRNVTEGLSQLARAFDAIIGAPIFPCILDDILVTRLYHQDPIWEFGNMIRIDVNKLMYFGSICAKLAYNTTMDEYRTEIGNRVTSISEFVPRWINSSYVCVIFLFNSILQGSLHIHQQPIHQLYIFINRLFINRSIHQPVYSSTGLFINRTIHQPVYSSTGLFINRSVHQPLKFRGK